MSATIQTCADLTFSEVSPLPADHMLLTHGYCCATCGERFMGGDEVEYPLDGFIRHKRCIVAPRALVAYGCEHYKVRGFEDAAPICPVCNHAMVRIETSDESLPTWPAQDFPFPKSMP